MPLFLTLPPQCLIAAHHFFSSPLCFSSDSVPLPLCLTTDLQVWAGDFNALTKWDYSEESWRGVGEVRARGGWELPQVLLVIFVVDNLVVVVAVRAMIQKGTGI